MRKMESLTDENIELTLPVNAAYVSAARLTASSIANRMGFNIEDIEDIKSAVSEACVYIIHSRISEKSFKVEFLLSPDKLKIILTTERGKNQPIPVEDKELGIVMIQALMDTLNVETNGAQTIISMEKNCDKH